MSPNTDVPEPLPRTANQAKRRAATRQHQRLWAAHSRGEPLILPTTPATWLRIQRKAAGWTKDYWKARGFRVCTQSNEDKTTLTVWLQPLKDERAWPKTL